MTNLMKSLNRAAKANMEGSNLLELGETSKALKTFRAGLKLLNDSCQAQANSSRSSSVTNSNTASIAAVASCPVQLGENHEGIIGNEQVAPSSFYSQSFLFVAPSSEGNVSLEEHSFFSAVLIYNTALALHQKGGNTGAAVNDVKGGRQAFLKSLLFYNEALNLLRPLLAAEQAEAFRVVQEIMRNQANIYYRLNDLGNVQRVWQDLATLTSTLGTASTGPHQVTQGGVRCIQKKCHVALSA